MMRPLQFNDIDRSHCLGRCRNTYRHKRYGNPSDNGEYPPADSRSGPTLLIEHEFPSVQPHFTEYDVRKF